MIERALWYPLSGEGAARRLVIGGVLVLAGPLVIPGLVVWGYVLRVIRSSLTDESAPGFDRPAELLGDGARVAVVVVVYWLPTVGLLAINAALPQFATGPLIGLGVQLLSVLLFFLVPAAGLSALYLLPAALVRLAATGSVRSAFTLSTLRPVVLTDDYFLGWIAVVAIVTAGGSIATALLLVVVGGFVWFYVFVSGAYVMARTYADAAETAVATTGDPAFRPEIGRE